MNRRHFLSLLSLTPAAALLPAPAAKVTQDLPYLGSTAVPAADYGSPSNPKWRVIKWPQEWPAIDPGQVFTTSGPQPCPTSHTTP